MSIRLLFTLMCEANHDRLERFENRLSAYVQSGQDRRHFVAMAAVCLCREVMELRRNEFRDMIHPMQVNDLLRARRGL